MERVAIQISFINRKIYHGGALVGSAILWLERGGATMNKPKIRCAIYTRKSSDEGLEQEFNSLDAQYESCAAYIASQKHEGWTLNLKNAMMMAGCRAVLWNGRGCGRCGQLLADIDAGLIDMIIVL